MTSIGSLFTGYGGLDMAVPGELAWYSEIEPAACKVLAAHHPDVPNLGDVKVVDWGTVPRVDILTGGYPCQPFSTAGLRKGKNDERHLWPYVRDAISTLRPNFIILENVANHLTLGFGNVIGDLSKMGYNARWGVVSASDAGAPHQRKRLFITANPASIVSGRRHFRYDTQDDAQSRRQRLQVPARRSSSVDFGRFTRAVTRWEQIIGREAPQPWVIVEGKDKVNPLFAEWMMGLPEGWVTGHGLNRKQELRLLGNGVMPQQAAYALNKLEKIA